MRFARSKGSKSSIGREPEDSTPWEVMKEQLLQAKNIEKDAKNREEAEKKRIENYENFLIDHKKQKRKAEWFEFENEGNSHNNEDVPNPKQSNKKKCKLDETDDQTNVVNSQKTPVSVVEKCNDNMKIKKNKNKSENKKTSENKLQAEETESSLNSNMKAKKKKNKKIKRSESEIDQANEVRSNTNGEESNLIDSRGSQTNMDGQNMKKKKNKKVKRSKNEIDQANEVQSNTNDEQSNLIDSRGSQTNMDGKNMKKKKNKNLVDSKPVRRKLINDNSFELVINGRNVELVRFDGFPVIKDDAKRLHDLKMNMVKKGIPKSEIQRTMKLERRRAEKALARLKRAVCYNCRKGGHNLSECPDLKSVIDLPHGVCFKCGSTEHKQFECKVQKDKQFNFAMCFICKESGHLARQCPDNPRGMYPNGGCCKLCGDVTHMKKDCPTLNDKKEDSSKLQTIHSANDLEDIGEIKKDTVIKEKSNNPKKIKF